MDLQQIGLGHPRIRQVMAIEKNTAPNPRKLFVAEGLWAHKLLLQTATAVEVFLWSPEAAYGDEARQRAAEVAAVAKAAYQISAKTLERISERDRPDGLLSIAQLREWQPEDLEFGPSALVMVADGMEIPGNLGTLIRTADACRVDCLVLTNRRTRLTHPKVFRASQGMMLTVPIIEFTQPEQAADWLAENDFDVYLADTDDARNYRSLRYRDRRTAFVLGAERYGIPKAWYRPGFGRVFVPMLGAADSLNVSISAAVLLYEARAQKENWLPVRREPKRTRPRPAGPLLRNGCRRRTSGRSRWRAGLARPGPDRLQPVVARPQSGRHNPRRPYRSRYARGAPPGMRQLPLLQRGFSPAASPSAAGAPVK